MNTFDSSSDRSITDIVVSDDSDEIHRSTTRRRRRSIRKRSNDNGNGNDQSQGDIPVAIDLETDSDDGIASNNEGYQNVIIRWKNNNYSFTHFPTYRTNVEEIFVRACIISKLDNSTASITNLSHGRKLERLKPLVFDAFKAIFGSCPSPKPFRILRTINRAGVYALSIGPRGTVIKYGMSFDCFARADRQSPAFAFKVADCNHLRGSIIPASIIQAIENLELPGLVYHSDHIERSRDLIAMQIYEGYMVAAHQDHDNSTCITNTIFERLVQEPPPLENLASVGSIVDEANKFLGDLCGSKAKVYGILSWPTIKSVVYGIAEKSQSLSEIIGSRLCEQPKDGFVKMYLIKAVLGRDNLCGWEDALPIPPEQDTLDQFLQATTTVLEQDPNDCNNVEKAQIQQALSKITGANCQSYVRPKLSDKTMADGFVSAFEQHLVQSLPAGRTT